MDTRLPHGTVITSSDGRVRRAVDRGGNEVWSARWNGDALHRITMVRPQRSTVVLDATSKPHPLFHRAHDILVDDAVVARCAQTDWTTPRFVPPVDVPAAMPPGAGSALLNVLATAALRAMRGPLHYRGPYPTAALFDSLTHSFRVDDPAAALQTFTRDVESRSIRGSMVEVGVPFHPAPFEWHWPEPGVCVQLRDGLERVYIDGRAYARLQAGTRRLRRDGEHWVAAIEFGGVQWHERGRFGADGTPLGALQPIPAAPPRLIGQALPEEIVELLGAILQQRVSRLLVPAVAQVMRTCVLRWGDTGDDLARSRPDAIEIHSAFGERLEDMDPQVMLAAFVLALEPVVARLAQQKLADRVDDGALP